MSKANEGPAFTRITARDVTVDAPNGVVHSEGQAPDAWYRGRFDTLTKKWLPNPGWRGNRTGE
jgi:hypothetical protein